MANSRKQMRARIGHGVMRGQCLRRQRKILVRHGPLHVLVCLGENAKRGVPRFNCLGYQACTRNAAAAHAQLCAD
ncbi:hypothetical protein [Rhodovulum strictum]|uniref:Uncharacterized protein n=1 Tax=Rhodovulum strictum TaxID=58314 RepID=A0A844BCV2_9RHOB|nr:hypothetical protein [Rhodovulum strictum]MRH20449.1 hypothetical protein [Rhodovulum strictum]